MPGDVGQRFGDDEVRGRLDGFGVPGGLYPRRDP